MSLLSRLLRPRSDDHAEVRPLWHRVVAIAREPGWYRHGGVADTLEGRFDAVTLVLALVLLRMERDPAMAGPSARLTELFVSDMDSQLRESGVGDLVVGKKIGRLMSVLGGRLGAYREGLAADDVTLQAAVARNVTLVDGAGPEAAAKEMRFIAAQLDGLDAGALLAGNIVR
jgi:cytochrome b pre-mRNA-processing protein 3